MNGSRSITRHRRLRRAIRAKPRVFRPGHAGVTDRPAEVRKDVMSAADSTRARSALAAELEYRVPPRWYRFPVTSGAAALSLFLFLLAFAEVLKPRVVPLPPSSAIEAQLIEPPAPKPVEPEKIAPAAPAKIAPAAPPKHPPVVHHVKPRPSVPPPQPQPESGTGSRETITVPSGGPSSGPQGARGESEGGSGGEGAGFSSGGGGARALYAPLPKIPDELRENVFSTVAVAHFVVDADGNVQVTLTTPTPNPRLNQLILDALNQLRFFPAMKDGISIASQFDVRIPIAVE
jgi:protein TonB